ncbi:putative sulfatase (plasmid) [Sinorhizobium fredii NGR234]|uniref:Sulfatase n=1 Tax=Sinorhizobium fredii (strain NBRC 101917 / NGR234) TaxID=394 RepID=C3KNN0_SINFN|nr:sulfatase-like hydrolase/transferase [Sinorhizobium fredii]ACP21688.1 putative sulfatase [Sinorhizobium fredii NGR234]
MKAVFVLFDSLNRHVLAPYGGRRVPTPNFTRLAERAATFDRHYVGSLPCMPARRDLQTGRLDFLHRSWGPLEPFDNSFPELLHRAGFYSHLVTDHFHYFEDGGATYHTRYDSYDFIRGQEGDPWKAMVQPPWERLRQMYHERQFSQSARDKFRRNIVNREFIKDESAFPSVRCFSAGLEFLERNRTADNWLLQIETFDPHEPFTAPERFREAFRTGWNGPVRDWPRYGRVDELPEECEELRANYYAVMALCDFLVGQLLDYFDRHDLWRDTALVVTTDHGFLLGEHDFWAKNRMNMYEEIVHIPLFLRDPRRPGSAGTRRSALTQTIDLAPTFLDLFDVPAAAEIEGHSLLPLLDADRSLRQGALFGYFGGAINVTDGRYTYHRFPPDLRSQELYQYTLMPTHIWEPFTPEELAGASLAQPMSFTKGAPVLKIPVIERSPMFDNYGPGALLESETRLYDLADDPGQNTPLYSPEIEEAMTRLMRDLMRSNDAPPEAFARIGIEAQ